MKIEKNLLIGLMKVLMNINLQIKQVLIQKKCLNLIDKQCDFVYNKNLNDNENLTVTDDDNVLNSILRKEFYFNAYLITYIFENFFKSPLNFQDNFDLADIFYEIHILGNYTLIALISLHISAVIIHKLLFKENLLKRIL